MLSLSDLMQVITFHKPFDDTQFCVGHAAFFDIRIQINIEAYNRFVLPIGAKHVIRSIAIVRQSDVTGIDFAA